MPTPPTDDVTPNRSETPTVHSNNQDASVKSSVTLDEALPPEAVNILDKSVRTAIPPRKKDESKKRPKVSIDISKIQLSELNLDKDIEARLIVTGYTTIQDLVPNKEKNDLLSNSILNRKSRREIEARLKQRKILLRLFSTTTNYIP